MPAPLTASSRLTWELKQVWRSHAPGLIGRAKSRLIRMRNKGPDHGAPDTELLLL